MNNVKRKLELTWVGKEERPRLEPRILVEDSTLSYGDPNAENMLIQGDNLLALKALEQDFASIIKCIYIDPPFNTGQAFEDYDDGLEHSIWLTMMRDRLRLLHELLADDGTMFVHIDDNELGYLLVLMDEIFRRENKVTVVTFKQGSATGHKAINPGCVNTTNFVVIYAKRKSTWKPNRIFTARERDRRYSQFITNRDENYGDWEVTTLARAFASENDCNERDLKERLGPAYEARLNEFILKNADRVIRLAKPDYDAVSSVARELIDKSNARPSEIFHLSREGHSDMYFVKGQRILFYCDKLKEIDGRLVAGEPLTTLWDDVLSNNLHNEGGVELPKGKKPEALLKRVLELATTEGDWVLDSFVGSGTTAAVAHKMNRRWIAVELNSQAEQKVYPRLKRVVDGEDPSGITSSVSWKGGGGFKFFRLAETLLVRDRDLSTHRKPVYVINPKYDAAMLIRAICKIENYRFRRNLLWHGISSERHFLYVTTKLLDQEQLNVLTNELSEDAALLIYCTRKTSELNVPDNIEIKKIPRDLLAQCAFEEGRV